MSISEPFIRRPVGTSLLAVGLLLLGIVAYHFLPIAPLPQIDFPTIQVQAGLPGVDPETAATSLASPLERRFGQIAGVSELTSGSNIGGASLTLQFDLDRSITGAARDVQAAINAAGGELPLNLPNPPTYRKVNPADAPVIILAMTSDTVPLAEVYNLADQVLGQRLSQVDGVSQVSIGGGAQSSVRIQVNPAVLASMGLSMESIRSVVSLVNVDAPKGMITSGSQSYVISSNDQLYEAKDYRSLIVTQHNGVPVQLGSIAKVIDAQVNIQQAGWSGSKRAVLLFVRKQSTANVIGIADQITALLPQLRRWLPPGVKLTVVSDRTQTIRASVHDVQITLLISVTLVVLVMFIFLRRAWPTFIAGVTVPLSLAGTFGVMYLLGYSLDNLSLMALTVSVGFVVDDAIVVIENIVRFIELGDGPIHAALKGARQIGFTVVSISLSLVAVFIPILFMGGLIGRVFHEFAVTLSVAIAMSALISLTLTPMLCAHFLKPENPDRGGGWFYETMEKFFEGFLGGYHRALRWVLRHQRWTLLVTLLTLVATVALYILIPKGFFPQQDTGLVVGFAEGGQDISFELMSKKVKQVSDVVATDPAVANLAGFVGGAALNNGFMFISLKPKNERDASADQIIDRLRPKLAKIPGITLYLQAAQDLRVGGRTGRSQYQYTLESSNLDDLRHWTPLLLEKLRKVSSLQDVNTDQQARGLQETVVIDRDAAARLGIQPQAVDDTLYSAFGQRQVSIIYTQQNQYRVVLEADPRFQQEASSLDKIFVTAANGQEVPLSAIAHYEMTNTSLSVNHQGQFPAVTMTFNVAPGVSLGQATRIIQQASRELGMPESIHGAFQGNAKVFQATLKTLPLLLITAIIAVYIVLGMLYESFIHPVTILSTLPSAGVGALLALYFFGMDLSLVSLIGIILLIGIVKKNAIMMIDFALELERHEGLSSEESIFQACITRFRPIMMTTLAAMFGAVPLALGMGTGSELRQPLGVAIVGGLLVSQALTLFTTPVVYLAFERFRPAGRARRTLSAPDPELTIARA